MDALTPEMMKQIAEHILKNPEEARNNEDLIDFYHKHCDEHKHCDNGDCIGGRKFEKDNKMFCSPCCVNTHYNYKKGDPDYWTTEEDDSSSEEEEDCAECCKCGEDVSNDEGEGKLVDGEYWCVDCVEDAHQCELCKKYFKETEYLPSKEDQEKQQLLGNDYCLECYKKVEKFEFVENIKDESESEEEDTSSEEEEETKITEYTCLDMEKIDYLGLFDDITYKYIKHLFKEEYYELEVEITDLESDQVDWCKTKFEFELQINVSQGLLSLYVDKKFSKVLEYKNSSPMALFMVDLEKY
jgi:hypothetical protein